MAAYKNLYEKLYRYYYKFCTTGVFIYDENLKNDTQGIECLEDFYRLYDLYNPNLNPKTSPVLNNQTKESFEVRVRKIETPLDDDDYLNRWMLYSLLCVTYEYLYPDKDKLKKYTELKQQIPDGSTLADLSFDHNEYNINVHGSKKEIFTDDYRKKVAVRNFRTQNRSFFIVLKGFSSSSPFANHALKERFHHIAIKGGGFFLKWKGYGIAIDPGIDFMDNMHDNDLLIQDINAVIVTHNHIDHNADLSKIDDLTYQFLRPKKIPVYCDKYTKQLYYPNSNEPIFKDEFKQHLDMTAIDDLTDSTVRIDVNRVSESYIILKFLPTEHIKNTTDGTYYPNTSWAVKIELYENDTVKKIIGFTSDTQYMGALPEFLTDCDYIVAHISEPNRDGYKQPTSNDIHLRYMGCLELINEIDKTVRNPKFIISEFWAGKGDIRKELVRQMRKDSKYDDIYPGDIGMMFFFDKPDIKKNTETDTFRCSQCLSEKMLDQLHIIRTGTEYSSLVAICSECILPPTATVNT